MRRVARFMEYTQPLSETRLAEEGPVKLILCVFAVLLLRYDT